jgi:ADP-ribose pyrophosphatase YjhB (NUDIX family)
MERIFLPEGVHSQATEALVFVGTDIIPINRERKTIYLTRRAVKPMQGWWWIGGRMFPGECEEDSARRCLKRETSLDFPPERFQFVDMCRHLCKDRQQEPQDKGLDNLCYTYVVELSPEELAQASQNLNEKEYEQGVGLQEFDQKRLAREGVRPAILDLYDEIFRS